MKKVFAALMLTAGIAATYSFTTLDHPVKADRMAVKPVKVGTGIGDEAPEIVMAGVYTRPYFHCIGDRYASKGQCAHPSMDV